MRATRKRKEYYEALDALGEARRKVEKELAVFESRTCRRRFSLCLDCDLHNHCPRYRRHRPSSIFHKEKA